MYLLLASLYDSPLFFFSRWTSRLEFSVEMFRMPYIGLLGKVHSPPNARDTLSFAQICSTTDTMLLCKSQIVDYRWLNTGSFPRHIQITEAISLVLSRCYGRRYKFSAGKMLWNQPLNEIAAPYISRGQAVESRSLYKRATKVSPLCFGGIDICLRFRLCQSKNTVKCALVY